MARNIVVEPLSSMYIENQGVEIVERKGIGHPDSIADGLAESVSRSLCNMYIKKFGKILHHNTDECQIVGGQSAPKFGGGIVLEPVQIILVGRATTEVEGERLPYRSVAVKAARDYLRKHCSHLNIDTDVTLECLIGQGSVDLRGVYETGNLLSNDTSFGVGFGPLSETEKITLETEQYINGRLKKSMPEVGEDVKVMACRMKDKINLTIAAAMVGSEIPDKSHYKNVVEELGEKALEQASRFTCREISANVNTADDYKKGIYYLTVTGLSMENGDDGSVGRGNRANGLITPYRPMSMEATAGKNPVTHVGKMYNILSNKIANDIFDEMGGNVLEVHVRILSQIGSPIDKPQTASVQIILADGVKMDKVKKDIVGIVDNRLENISDITDLIVKGKIPTF
ncbi:MAG: methionine adenosyltransferase [Candidatus Thermoplasmatota archaeon]|nr:methionine adenosyltransferase [Euryarchaeota archaeon]MBU4032226.1 methionine adenosyltransferase [Candidatus Thermoplasmatota archaeon]MBU4071914.1 methionine adenosyltransferase [Candidatus Thermoplasmatota archaeon]MBU4144213.1 methionine adenosyltransferase [Candidatus Thermoplasmatota archaeon]MBU4591101.1 methionine adenosyltransferase [Candidatus Thermoplasmatota archaeon]